MVSYIPLFFSSRLSLNLNCGYEIKPFDEMDESIQRMILDVTGGPPDSVVISEGDNVCLDRFHKSGVARILALAVQRPVFYYCIINDTGYCSESAPGIFIEGQSELIRLDHLQDFLNVAVDNYDQIPDCVGIWYEIAFESVSCEPKIILLASLLERLSNHVVGGERELITKADLKTIREYVKEKFKASEKKDEIVNTVCGLLSNIKYKSTKQKVNELCKICDLINYEDSVKKLYETRNPWIHGGNNIDVDVVAVYLCRWRLICELVLVWLLTGKDSNYLHYVNPFSLPELVEWDMFFINREIE